MSQLSTIDPWKFAAGLGIFLLAMTMVEEALKNLAGRRFKIVLRDYTNKPFKGLVTGTIATAVLQSSSVVTLMVLSFVGAGIIDMRSALGVVFGSNLGTTFTGWIVATLGFKLDIQLFSFPMIAVGTLMSILVPRKRGLSQFFRFLASLGLLFLGLEFMKSAMANVSQHLDVSVLHGYNLVFYGLFGVILTAIIQSSSATMMITLTALNAGLLTLPMAAALVIGADIGTTSTTLFGALGGTPEKKQTALSHFIFNLVTGGVASILLKPMLIFVQWASGGDHPLIALVLFHSTFNVLGICLFFPLIKPFASFLEKHFGASDKEIVHHINKVSISVPEAAVTALDNEVSDLVQDVVNCNLQAYGLRRLGEPFLSVYDELKTKFGEILEYLLSLQAEKIGEKEASRLLQLLKVHDYLSRSAKEAKDIHHDMNDFELSATPKMIEFQNHINKFLSSFYEQFSHLTEINNSDHLKEELTRLRGMDLEQFNSRQKEIFEASRRNDLSEKKIATLLNINREIHASNQNLMMSVSEFRSLNTQQNNLTN